MISHVQHEHRHLHQRHAGRAHVEDRDDDVDRAHDRRRAHDVDARRSPCPCPMPICTDSGAYSVQPAAGRAARHEERADQQQGRGERQQPEAPVVHARERHVGRADLQRHLQFAKPTNAGMIAPNTMIRPCMRGELVEELRLDELQARLEQLGADHQRHHAAGEEHGEREPQVQRADVLVVGGHDPAHDAGRVVRVLVVRHGRGPRAWPAA